MEAARFWAGQGKALDFAPDEEVVRQLKANGAPPDVIEKVINQVAPSEFEVFPECWTTLEIFLSLSSQWRMVVGAAAVQHQGIEFASIQVALDEFGLKGKVRKRTWSELLLMERSAVSILNKG